jgi:hypothetical protein
MKKVLENIILLLEKKITKSHLKRFYYITVAFCILHIRAGYNFFVPIVKAAVFLVFTLVIYISLVLILSRILRESIVVIQAASNVVKIRVNLYVSTLDAENRRRVLLIGCCTILLLPTFLVCCFFWKEAYQEALGGYTNIILLLKTLSNGIYVYLQLTYLKFVLTAKIVYHNIMFDLLETYYDLMFDLVELYYDLFYFVMEKLEKGMHFIILVCLICKEVFSFIVYVIFVYLPAILQVGCNLFLAWIIVTYQYVLVDYNLFLDWIIVTYRYVLELFHKSIFFEIYTVSSATYLALCEAKAELQRESLMAERFVLETKLWNGDSIKLSYSYLGLIDSMIDISICRVVFILLARIYRYFKEKLSSYYMRAKMAAYFKDQADKSGKLDFLNSKPEEESGKLDFLKSKPEEKSGKLDFLKSKPEEESGKLDFLKSKPEEESGKLDLVKSKPDLSGKRKLL